MKNWVLSKDYLKEAFIIFFKAVFAFSRKARLPYMYYHQMIGLFGIDLGTYRIFSLLHATFVYRNIFLLH